MAKQANDKEPLPRVVINGRFLGQRITGVQRYARETLVCLDALIGQGEGAFARWVVALPPETPNPVLRNIQVEQVGRRRGHAWEQIDLAWYARNALLLSFGFTGPAVLSNQVITVHDAAVMRMPLAYRWYFRLWYRVLVRWVARRAPLVFCVSAFAGREAQACFSVAATKLRQTTEGWQHLQRVQPDESILDQHRLRDRRFVLAVSSPTANKNFSAVVEALALLGPQAPLCAVAGAADHGVFPQTTSNSSQLLHLGYVSDAALKALYQHASCFVFPSFYEGFGIPALEAMASGCAVVASTAPAIREVCGDAALYFNPHEPAELAQRLREVFASPELCEQMAQRGLARAGCFSWEAGARLHLKHLREALALPNIDPGHHVATAERRL